MCEDFVTASDKDEKVDKDQLFSEIDKEYAEHLSTEQGAFGFFNNFEVWLPGGIHEKFPDTEHVLPPDSLAWDYLGVSERFKKATYGDLRNDTKRAIELSGVDVNELNHRREFYKNAEGGAVKFTAKNTYLMYSLPIYKQLRLMGYTHHDLTH